MSMVPWRNNYRTNAGIVRYRRTLSNAFKAWKGISRAAKYIRNKKRSQRLARKFKRPTTKLNLHQRATQQGTGGSFSAFSYGRRMRNRLVNRFYRSMAKKYYTNDETLLIDCANNLQKFGVPLTMYNPTDVNDQFYKAFISSHDLNATSRALLESCSGELQLTNLSNTNARIVIYDIIARRTTTESIDNCLFYGIIDEEDPGSSSPNTWGFNPFTNVKFTHNYRVVKMTHILMAQGQTHVHKVFYKPNKVLNLYSIGEIAGATTAGVQGLTCYSLVCVKGTPALVHETTNVATTSPLISCVSRRSYKFAGFSGNTTTLDLQTTLTNEGQVDIENIATGAEAPDTDVT